MKFLFYSYLAAMFSCAVGAVSCNSLQAKEDGTNKGFEYRDIYLPEYTETDNRQLDLNTIDMDWGLWGHNLGSLLPDYASKQVYARVNGVMNPNQFCFSSDKLYDYIADYINSHYRFSDTMRFAILPNDNDIVCLCTECRLKGNKPGNASPAVLSLIERLSAEFPKHQFFTSYYSTTSDLPENQMAPNAGVLVSAIDYPLSTVPTPRETQFMELLSQWKTKTDKIYVWDYIQNFDDYFTPFPVYSVMQKRLREYKAAGVTGVFLNGSGSDYSTFSSLHKRVLAQLLKNPDADWEELLKRYAEELYPVAGKDIADFIIAQEKMVSENGAILPMYEGVEKALNTYLPEAEFVDFYNKIVKHKKVAGPEEKNELELMTDAMALTMLELKRINGDFSDTGHLKERLGRLPNKGITMYNEGCWSINKYLSNFLDIENNIQNTASSNLLKGTRLKALNPLDEDYSDITILTDGQLGIPSNYHDGILISSADPQLSISVPAVPEMKKLKVWLVYNPGFKVGLPEEVSLSVGGRTVERKTPEKPEGGSGHVILEFDLPSRNDVVVTFRKNPEIKTMAIDEIEAF